MDPIILLIILLLLVACSAFYAASEIAIVSLPQVDVESIKKKYPKIGERLEYHRNNAQRFVINISIANNFINIFASSLATATLVLLFPKYGVAIATIGMTLLILLFGEIIPKVLAIAHTKKIAQKSATPLYVSARLLAPFIFLFTIIVKLIAKEQKGKEEVSTEALNYYVQKSFESGTLSSKDKEYIQNIIQMDLVSARDIMTPKDHVLELSANITAGEAAKEMKKTGYSRAPVFEEYKENIIGMIHAKDLLDIKKSKKIKSMIRQSLFVPDVMRVDILLQELQKSDHHFAIINNPDGNYVGIATIEDVIEEIVGEIYDETDKRVVYLKQLTPKVYHIQGDYSLFDFNKKFKTKLRGANSIGGYVVKKLRRVPETGEVVKIAAGKFKVLHVHHYKIKKLKFTKGRKK